MNRNPSEWSCRRPVIPYLLVGLFFRGEQREVVLGDLDEGFADALAHTGSGREARRWYWWHASDSLWALLKEHARRKKESHLTAPRRDNKLPRRTKGDSRMLLTMHEACVAVRSLLRRPIFSFIAVLTVALGIGANAAVFSVLNGVVLKPLPYESPEGLVSVSMTSSSRPNVWDDMSHPDIADLLAQSPSLATLVGYDDMTLTLSGTGEPALVRAARLTDGLMGTFQVAPTLGRDIQAEECGPGAPRVTVISHGLWRDRFNRETDVLGKTIGINGRNYVIVGVAPEGFNFPPSNPVVDTSPATSGELRTRLSHVAHGGSLGSRRYSELEQIRG